MKSALLLTVICAMAACANTQKNSQRTQPMDAIIDSTFATNQAMQEERVEQGEYIAEQEQRYE